MTMTVLGALLGLVAAGGLLLIITGAPPARTISLADRIAPYLRETPRPSRLIAPTHASGRGTLGRLTPQARRIAAAIDRWVGGSESVRRRLVALDDERTVEDIRFEQVVWAAIGLTTGALVGAVMSLLSGQVVVGSIALLAVAGLVGGVLGRDWWLTQQVRRRDERMLTEFPVVADLLALAVTAGEAPQAALERVSRLVGGELGRSIQRALADAKTGMPLAESLERMANASRLEPLSRFIDGIVVAMERGTPLADVLRAQAADVREQGKRRLLEAGGRKEVAMLVPVVFLVLPVTVLFALFPGLFSIIQLSR
ncbi:pilus assembly protein TadB [Epidermidibacterium keratini]|uniref:Pilus assembly protein TadB n=1 Tax=Epidermidibacterium keratini TaxID=1891644 RepID=A0A7L4YK14_9ACTN|nr:type II secretion system F family protein [Epidermidibacterium keratini]QHB99594.1 pilus assembly protein TadB [Epidermidibacterium keratini]